MLKPLLALGLACITLQAHAAGRTIVGDWATSPADCGTQFAYRIGARSIVTDDASCSFDGVSRKGDTVTFTGRCSNGNEPDPETVVATRTGETLSMRYLRGGDTVSLVSCGPKGSPR